MTHVDRPRLVLDPGAHRDPGRRDHRRAVRRAAHPHDDAAPGLRAPARRDRRVGLPGSVRRVPRGVGCRDDGRVGPVRQLVAQRVWPGRQDPEPAAHGADARDPGGRSRRRAARARGDEPRVRAGPGAARPRDVRDRRRGPRARDDRDPRAHAARQPAPRRRVSRDGAGRAGRPARAGPGREPAVGRDDARGVLHRVHGRDAVAVSALPRRAQARPRLPVDHALHPARVPTADPRAGDRDRPRAPAARGLAARAARAGARRGVPRDAGRRAVAVRGVPAVAPIRSSSPPACG